MSTPSERKNAKKVTKKPQKRQKSTLCAHFIAKKHTENDIVSEIELLAPSAFTISSLATQKVRCARMSSRAPKPATFVDESPLRSPIQEAEVNQATPNHPPPPNTQIPQQTGPKYGESGEIGIANIAAKSCFDMLFARTKRAQKCHSRAQKRHSRTQKQDFARICVPLQTSLWENGTSGEESVVRGQWSVAGTP